MMSNHRETNLMPRREREQSGTGIYHVMLRGINRQDIFEEAEDSGSLLYSEHSDTSIVSFTNSDQ